MIVLYELNEKEQTAIEELKMRMENFLTPGLLEEELQELLYYRFLKARDFDVNNAEKMLKKHIIWRKANQIDTILEDFQPTEFFRKFPEVSPIGYDKEGNKVLYSPTGKFNPVDIMKCMTNSSFMKHWMWFGQNTISTGRAEREMAENEGIQGVFIIDLDQLTFANTASRISLNLFVQFIRMYQDNYPERMDSTFVINAPHYYVIVFSVLKTMMSSAMVKKIHIFGRNGWKEKLLEKIDKDVLPAFLGGKRTDPDGSPLCKTFITHGGKIPEYYYLLENERYFQDPSQIKIVTVLPTKKEVIQVELNNLGSLLQWEFLVKGKDIGFGIFFQASENKINEVIPIQKYNTYDGAEKGSYKCRTIGKYIIVFDNSYSWMNSKEVQYCITVMCGSSKH